MDIIPYDMFYQIYSCRPIALIAQIHRERTRRSRMDTREQYWLEKFPALVDDDSSNSFKAHYRVTRRTFDWLLRELKQCGEYLGSQMYGGYAGELQVACVLWRFSDTHFGYRFAYTHLVVQLVLIVTSQRGL